MGAYQGVMERYGSTAHRYGTLWNITQRCRTLQNVAEALQGVGCEALWNSMEQSCGTLRNVTEALRIIMVHYGSGIELLRNITEIDIFYK